MKKNKTIIGDIITIILMLLALAVLIASFKGIEFLIQKKLHENVHSSKIATSSILKNENENAITKNGQIGQEEIDIAEIISDDRVQQDSLKLPNQEELDKLLKLIQKRNNNVALTPEEITQIVKVAIASQDPTINFCGRMVTELLQLPQYVPSNEVPFVKEKVDTSKLMDSILFMKNGNYAFAKNYLEKLAEEYNQGK